MSQFNRREAVKWAVGAAACAGGLAGRAAGGDEKPVGGGQPGIAPQQVTSQRPTDAALEQALRSPSTFMFREQVTFKLEGDRHSRDLYITSARNPEGKPERVRVPSASMRIFRADSSVDEFTREGGVYWQFFGKEGKFQLKDPGAIVLIVRDHDDTVRCYSLIHDVRC
jgi:hypothetical protein